MRRLEKRCEFCYIYDCEVLDGEVLHRAEPDASNDTGTNDLKEVTYNHEYDEDVFIDGIDDRSSGHRGESVGWPGWTDDGVCLCDPHEFRNILVQR